MNTNLYNRIKELALSIEKFRQLDSTEQAWLKDLLLLGTGGFIVLGTAVNYRR